MASSLPMSRSEWKAALDALPSTPARIPSFFFGHGSPMLVTSGKGVGGSMKLILDFTGPNGPLATFLQDFGPVLIEKYKPKGIVVFSAHWETHGERLVTDYGDQNPLLMDYFGFDPEMYELKFNSRGDSALAHRVVEFFKEAGLKARTTNKLEQRGRDGRGFSGPGLDHGVFIPFRLMFGTEYRDIPIVQASIDGSLSPEGNWATGKAVAKLREEGILVLSGGLTVHNLRDFASFNPETANPVAKSFNDAVNDAISISDPKQRKAAMIALTRHPGFRIAHPREDHFVPIYIAGGAGEDGDVRILSANFGSQTAAFGL